MSFPAIILPLVAYAAFLPTVPGAVNPDVTQDNIATTICKRHPIGKHSWVHNQRPPVSYTNGIKRKLMDAAGIPWSDRNKYELDHAWPIEDGGNPRDPNNLWLEPWDGPHGAHRKDVLETKIGHLLCKGQITLAEVPQVFFPDWTESYRQYIGKLP